MSEKIIRIIHDCLTGTTIEEEVELETVEELRKEPDETPSET
jgi:hypothetical protein